MTAAVTSAPVDALSHLRPDLWATANAALVRKMIAEFAHELLLHPQPDERHNEPERYRLESDDGNVEYRFRARRYRLDHWHVDTGSITRRVGGRGAPLDACAFILEFRKRLGIGASVLPTYLQEISSTLASDAYKRLHRRYDAADLAYAGFQDVEAAMTEGHPCFIANNGRIGFDTDDYRAYAPEAGNPIRLVWLAAHIGRAKFSSIDGLSCEGLLRDELDAGTRDAFVGKLRGMGLDPDAYLFLPAHPWQWRNTLASAFAGDIATRHLVHLGESEDRYQAQQSIRTFFNLSRPDRCYVKTALSIRNMGFLRGLSPDYMRTTPAINQWIYELVSADPYLQARGFRILREVAAVGYRNPLLEAATDDKSPYRKMLASLWRESPVGILKPRQRLLTMASLLHVDAQGNALLPALIRASGCDTDTWLRRYLACYLAPLLHCFFAHDLVFMPHGENLILVLEGHLPVRALMKDIGEETAVMNPNASLPDDVQRLAVSVPDELKPLSLFTDVFDCFFRFMTPLLDDGLDYPEERFWSLVAECISRYQRTHPELGAKFARFDLFAPSFQRSCLNRLQLRDNEQLIDLGDPAGSLQLVGELTNPVAGFRALPGAAETVPAPHLHTNHRESAGQ